VVAVTAVVVVVEVEDVVVVVTAASGSGGQARTTTKRRVEGLTKGLTVVATTSTTGAASSITDPMGQPAGKLNEPADVRTLSSASTGPLARYISSFIRSDPGWEINDPSWSPTITVRP
jgi:hypothetical protein